MSDPTTTGGLVKDLRDRHPWTLRDLAARAGIDERTWRRVEAGEGYSRATIHGIARALDTTVAVLEPITDAPMVSQLDRIEEQVATALELLRQVADQQTAQAEAMAAVEGALELAVPPRGKQRRAPA